MLRTTRLLSPAMRRSHFVQRRFQSTEEAPKSNPHRDFYKHRSRAVLKNALIAIFTYEILYWGWLKLESIEVKDDTESEMKSLENEIRSVTSK